MAEGLRFVAKYANHKIPAREHYEEEYANGRSRIITQGILCEFTHGGLHEYEIDAAQEQLGPFRGTLLMDDEVTPVPIRHRFSVYDTAAEQKRNRWSDEVRKEVEAALLENEMHGIDYIQVEKPVVPAPFPNWDTLRGRGQRTTADLLAERVRELGIDPNHAI